MANMKEYQKGRMDGMELAYRIAKENGLSGLLDEIRFRGKAKVNTGLMMKELEDASEPMRGFINEGHILIWLAVLHDEFGFGNKRLNQAMDKFEQIYTAIEGGYAGFADYIEEMSKKMGRQLTSRFLSEDAHWEKDPEK